MVTTVDFGAFLGGRLKYVGYGAERVKIFSFKINNFGKDFYVHHTFTYPQLVCVMARSRLINKTKIVHFYNPLGRASCVRM